MLAQRKNRAISKFTQAVLVAAAIALFIESDAAPAPSRVLTPEQIIAARQASLDLSVMDMAEMKTAVTDGLDVKKQFYPARTLARWARALPSMFPEGTGQGATSVETHALANVWTDRAGFEKAAATYAAAADKLGQLAQAGDSAGFATQLAAVAKTCDGCHDNFKQKYP
jgi:cytochrome c556